MTALKGDRFAALAAPDDPDTAVRAAFDLSYAALEPAVRRTFRLLGLMPGRDLAAPAVATMAECDLAEVGRCLRVLTSAHLVEERAGRYTFHDLLRLYAAELSTGDAAAARDRRQRRHPDHDRAPPDVADAVRTPPHHRAVAGDRRDRARRGGTRR